MYRNASKGVGSSSTGWGRSSEGGTSREGFDPLTVAGSINCHHPCHTVKERNKPINTTQQAKRNREFYAK